MVGVCKPVARLSLSRRKCSTPAVRAQQRRGQVPDPVFLNERKRMWGCQHLHTHQTQSRNVKKQRPNLFRHPLDLQRKHIHTEMLTCAYKHTQSSCTQTLTHTKREKKRMRRGKWSLFFHSWCYCLHLSPAEPSFLLRLPQSICDEEVILKGHGNEARERAAKMQYARGRVYECTCVWEQNPGSVFP